MLMSILRSYRGKSIGFVHLKKKKRGLKSNTTKAALPTGTAQRYRSVGWPFLSKDGERQKWRLSSFQSVGKSYEGNIF